MMKKRFLVVLMALAILMSFAACGGASRDAGQGVYTSENAMSNAMVPEPGEPGLSAESAGYAPNSGGNQPRLSDKMIYTCYAEVETRDLDAAVERVNALISEMGGFLENSSVTGTSLNGGGRRSAGFTIRIPSDKFSEMTDSLGELGNVVSSTTSAENITAQYNDTQSRLDAYGIEYERLLAMLEKAETVEEMLAIESRLSDVRYQIESATNTLSGWDSLINYSTLSLDISEVKEFTEVVDEKSFGERVSDAFSSSLRWTGAFFKSLAVFVIAALPQLVILAAVSVAVVLVVRRVRKRRRQIPPAGKKDEDDS